ncbi:MAG: hypothetical protein M0036_08880 [Desulfobacteraceae bacterium]|nr:hypothetical protein [Desulfobacteraceae bacterium]
MTDDTDQYKISIWLAEFTDRDVEKSFQRHVQPIMTRQLRIALMVWGVLLLLFAIPDYIALGAVRPFYYLLTFRMVTVAALLILFFMIAPETTIFEITYPVAAVVVAYISGFMMFFIYRPDSVQLVLGVIMLQVISLLMFVPIRFIISFFAALYAVFITLLTRLVLGAPIRGLIGLFVVFMLPVVVGAVTAIRLGVLQRKQFALLCETEKINKDLQKALSENKELSGLLPICSSCKKIRNDGGYWEQIEGYIRDHSKAEFSHGLCPDCAIKLYPDLYRPK